MFDSSSIARLYDNVLREDIVQYGITDQEIRRGIQIMTAVYRPDPENSSLKSDNVSIANYNEIALRYAYLHKYAAFHTALVLDAMNQILERHQPLFKNLVSTGQFKLCCLGGGPGSDAIGILAALNFTFGIFKKNVVIIDIMEDWKLTFDALIQEIIYGSYSIQKNFTYEYFQWDYIGVNLLGNMSSAAKNEISNASFISMIKFVSAAACQNTEGMITEIFTIMKPGAIVLFIDNAAGGFRQLIRGAAKHVGLITIFGPINHHKYSNEELKAIRFGYTSCSSTTVTIHLLQKPHPNKQTKRNNPNRRQQRNSKSPTVIFHETLPTVDNTLNSKLHSPHKIVSSGSVSTAKFQKTLPTVDNVSNSKLHSPHNIVSPGSVSTAKFQKTLPTVDNASNSNLHSSHNSVSTAIFRKTLPTVDNSLNSKLHSPNNSVSAGSGSTTAFQKTLPTVDNPLTSKLHSPHDSVSSGSLYTAFHKTLQTADNSLNSKLHSPHNGVSSDKNTNLNKSYNSNEIKSAKQILRNAVLPDNDQKLNNKLPKTSLNRQVPKTITRTCNQMPNSYIPPKQASSISGESSLLFPKNITRNYNQIPYSSISSEPVSRINVRSSRSYAQSNPGAFSEPSNNSGGGCCSCCVIS